MPYEKVNEKFQEMSGARTFTIEEWVSQDEVNSGLQIWLVSKKSPSHRARLPVPDPHKNNPFSFDRFHVSPDERVLIALRKVCSGVDEAFVFHRTSDPLHYRLADPVSLNQRIYTRFGRPKEANEINGGYEKTVEFLLFQDWKSSREAVLACLYGRRNHAIPYLVTFNTRTGIFHNYHRITVSELK